MIFQHPHQAPFRQIALDMEHRHLGEPEAEQHAVAEALGPGHREGGANFHSDRLACILELERGERACRDRAQSDRAVMHQVFRCCWNAVPVEIGRRRAGDPVEHRHPAPPGRCRGGRRNAGRNRRLRAPRRPIGRFRSSRSPRRGSAPGNRAGRGSRNGGRSCLALPREACLAARHRGTRLRHPRHRPGSRGSGDNRPRRRGSGGPRGWCAEASARRAWPRGGRSPASRSTVECRGRARPG